MQRKREVRLTVNGRELTAQVEPRMTLADLLRDELGLTGTHVGCEQGVCGACTVLMDGRSVRSCLLLAVQAGGHELTTVEGLSPDGQQFHPVQQAFYEEHALQCGFCTPGFLITAEEFLKENPNPSESEIRERLSGNLCRCTGYQHIVKAVQRSAELIAQTGRMEE